MKLYTNSPANVFAQTSLVAADLAGVPVQVIHMNPEAAKAKEFAAKHLTGKFPLLETADGEMIFESLAIAEFFAAHAPTAGLHGQTPFQAAKVAEWISYVQTSLWAAVMPIAYAEFGHKEATKDQAAKNAKALLDQCKYINSSLKESAFLVGDNLTLADIATAAALSIPYQTTFGSEFFTKLPAVAAWLERIVGLPSFVRRFGYVKKSSKAPAAAAAATPAAAKDDDDDLDLFGDDEEVAAKPAKIEIKKKKKEVIAMSLVMLEVKPLDSDTNLDELA